MFESYTKEQIKASMAQVESMYRDTNDQFYFNMYLKLMEELNNRAEA